MSDPTQTTRPEQVETAGGDDELPPGNHALEIAARRGFGPLSPLGREVWHGRAMPCVSCGQLVRRGDESCGDCGQDLSDEMLEKMLLHAGPWYVLEHVRPFPGVTRERIVRQILRGLVTPTSIVRGPETDHQWRFAGETPGLCRYFGRCWNCQERVEPMDAVCKACLSSLAFRHGEALEVGLSPERADGALAAEGRKAAESADRMAPAALRRAAGAPGGAATGAELQRLEAAVRSTPAVERYTTAMEEARILGIRPFWVLGFLLMIVIVVLMVLIQLRGAV